MGQRAGQEGGEELRWAVSGAADRENADARCSQAQEQTTKQAALGGGGGGEGGRPAPDRLDRPLVEALERLDHRAAHGEDLDGVHNASLACFAVAGRGVRDGKDVIVEREELQRRHARGHLEVERDLIGRPVAVEERVEKAHAALRATPREEAREVRRQPVARRRGSGREFLEASEGWQRAHPGTGWQWRGA